MKRPDPVAKGDEGARDLANRLMATDHAALAWSDPLTETPGISRIAFGLDLERCPITLISSLSLHFAALKANPACALLLGERGDRGDPLAHPRLMIRAMAQFITPKDPRRPGLRSHWLKGHPKAALYADFADFAFVLLHPESGLLNAGFARAFSLSQADLALKPDYRNAE